MFHLPFPLRPSRSTGFAILLLLIGRLAAEDLSYFATQSLSVPEANQAAAASERFVFGIGSTLVAKYDRATGSRVSVSTGPAHHLNSGFLWDGKLYCAHSNYPATPEKSEIMVLDPDVMEIRSFHDFGPSRGSLTWCVQEAGHWWCTFAQYGARKNAGTVLVKFDAEWHERGVWTYPPEVIKDLGSYSISGGVWKDGHLLVTGHDHRMIYELRLPEQGSVLGWIRTIPSPFPGQGIAIDPVTGGLVGIDRAKKTVIFAKLRP